MTLSVGEPAFRAKILIGLEFIIRDVRRDSELSERRGAGSRSARWYVRQSWRTRRSK